MADNTTFFVPTLPSNSSQASKELVGAKLRSHAARIAHQRRKRLQGQGEQATCEVPTNLQAQAGFGKHVSACLTNKAQVPFDRRKHLLLPLAEGRRCPDSTTEMTPASKDAQSLSKRFGRLTFENAARCYGNFIYSVGSPVDPFATTLATKTPAALPLLHFCSQWQNAPFIWISALDGEGELVLRPSLSLNVLVRKCIVDDLRMFSLLLFVTTAAEYTGLRQFGERHVGHLLQKCLSLLRKELQTDTYNRIDLLCAVSMMALAADQQGDENACLAHLDVVFSLSQTIDAEVFANAGRLQAFPSYLVAFAFSRMHSPVLALPKAQMEFPIDEQLLPPDLLQDAAQFRGEWGQVALQLLRCVQLSAVAKTYRQPPSECSWIAGKLLNVAHQLLTAKKAPVDGIACHTGLERTRISLLLWTILLLPPIVGLDGIGLHVLPFKTYILERYKSSCYPEVYTALVHWNMTLTALQTKESPKHQATDLAAKVMAQDSQGQRKIDANIEKEVVFRLLHIIKDLEAKGTVQLGDVMEKFLHLVSLDRLESSGHNPGNSVDRRDYHTTFVL